MPKSKHKRKGKARCKPRGPLLEAPADPLDRLHHFLNLVNRQKRSEVMRFFLERFPASVLSEVVGRTQEGYQAITIAAVALHTMFHNAGVLESELKEYAGSTAWMLLMESLVREGVGEWVRMPSRPMEGNKQLTFRLLPCSVEEFRALQPSQVQMVALLLEGFAERHGQDAEAEELRRITDEVKQPWKN